LIPISWTFILEVIAYHCLDLKLMREISKPYVHYPFGQRTYSLQYKEAFAIRMNPRNPILCEPRGESPPRTAESIVESTTTDFTTIDELASWIYEYVTLIIYHLGHAGYSFSLLETLILVIPWT
jgi:hypothetical protein